MTLASLRDWPTALRVAVALLLGALLFDALLLLRAPRTADVPPLVLAPVPRIAVQFVDDAEILRNAASRAPFGGTPATDMLAASTILQQSTVAPPPERPRLLGTVVEGRGGGFVVVEMPGARVQLVRIGEKAGDLRLRSVSTGEAVFDDPRDARITLKTSPPDSRP